MNHSRRLLPLFVLLAAAWAVFPGSARAGLSFDDQPVVVGNSADTAGGAGDAAAAPAAMAPTGFPLRIASYNIAHGRGVKVGGLNEIAKLKNLKAIAALLRREEVDVVGISEISKHDARAKFIDQAKYLANRLDFHHVYAENTERGWGLVTSQGNAVLSRHPIVWSQNHKLWRISDASEQRGCLETLIDLGQGRRLRFLVCHLSTNSTESPRQIEQILALVKASKEPVVLAGDFNLRPTSGGIKALAKEMKDASAGLVTTQAVKGSKESKIDYLFVAGPVTFGVAWTTGVKERLSDHDCLINRFWIGETPAAP
ncbi:MAG: hypothetical protein GX442_24200 [Candidatus Riflebacteria bacterium]|nr:hypothetical protein [Candidatus Riflebacteria bacterium]